MRRVLRAAYYVPPTMGRLPRTACCFSAVRRLLVGHDWPPIAGRRLLTARASGRLLLAAYAWPPTVDRLLVAYLLLAAYTAGRLYCWPHILLVAEYLPLLLLTRPSRYCY